MHFQRAVIQHRVQCGPAWWLQQLDCILGSFQDLVAHGVEVWDRTRPHQWTNGCRLSCVFGWIGSSQIGDDA